MRRYAVYCADIARTAIRKALVTLDLRLPDNASEADYVKALLEAVPTKATLVSDGNEPASDGNGGDENGNG